MRLMAAMQSGPAPQIRHLALTNFDTDHMAVLVENGIRVVSNQVRQCCGRWAPRAPC